MEITKKDWEDVKKQAEVFLHDAMVNVEVYKSTVAKAEWEINNFEKQEQTGAQ